MTTFRRVYPDKDQLIYTVAWMWMFQQGELYAENAGFDNFDSFCHLAFEAIDFAIEEDSRLLAFCSLILRGKGNCQAALIAPARPRIRPILSALRDLQKAYFEDLGHYLFVSLPGDEQFDRARTIARLMGWRQISPNYFEYHLADHLEAQK